MSLIKDDAYWMQQALIEAKKAENKGEVPVGAVLVKEHKQMGAGFNQSISNNDPTAHAEIMALRAAAKGQDNYRLVGSTLYVTLEPCLMCTGAMIHARISRLVFGAFDQKTGVIESVTHMLDDYKWNHKIAYQGGILETECAKLLKSFFQSKRK